MQMPQLSAMRKIDISIISLRDTLAMNDDFVSQIYHRNKLGTNDKLYIHACFSKNMHPHTRHSKDPSINTQLT